MNNLIPQKITKSAAVDFPTLLRMLAGGAAVGAGTGAVTTYLRHLKTLNERAKKHDDTAYDDDVLYLNLPAKRAAANSTGTYALGGISGLLGLYLGYNAVRSAYQRARKRQMQQELDQAQNVYVDALNQSTSAKQAGQFSVGTKLVGGGQMAALLMLLGSAAVTNRILQKQFPPIKNPADTRMRKIVIRQRGSEDEPQPLTTGGDPDEVENLMHKHLENKRASQDSGMADLVAAIANGRGDEIRNNVVTYGVDMALDAVQGASQEKTSAVRNQLAVTYLARDPLLSNAFAPVLASFFYDTAKGACVLARNIPSDCLEELVGLTKASAWRRREKLCQQLGWQRSDEKSAGVEAPRPLKDLFIIGTLAHMFSNAGDEDEEQKDNTQNATTNVSPSTNSPNQPEGNLPMEASDSEALQFARKNEKLLQGFRQTV